MRGRLHFCTGQTSLFIITKSYVFVKQVVALFCRVPFYIFLTSLVSNNHRHQIIYCKKNNEKLFLVGEAITGLYEAESLTRNIVQTYDTNKFKTYKIKIDTILNTIDKVSQISDDTLQTQKIDSIESLIDRKNKNLEELIKIYKQRKQKGLYETAIDELKKVNKSF